MLSLRGIEKKNNRHKSFKEIITIGWFFVLLLISSCSSSNQNSEAQPVNRHALVTRHNPVLTTSDKLSPLTVGNGEFAYTADVTGLQTFLEFYSRDGETNSTPPGPDGFETNPKLEGSTTLVTPSQWGWHTSRIRKILLWKMQCRLMIQTKSSCPTQAGKIRRWVTGFGKILID